ncbi:large ribosomal subunit protein bL34m [Ochotona princeps]|uniref:large ribosomal subunit protein bL34m n=1 Tax=Ochotona princeps TaxID=9978 RepID=UPI002714B8BE|nr:large ribosomal subunit protein bL34m [Ochotona princeps]
MCPAGGPAAPRPLLARALNYNPQYAVLRARASALAWLGCAGVRLQLPMPPAALGRNYISQKARAAFRNGGVSGWTWLSGWALSSAAAPGRPPCWLAGASCSLGRAAASWARCPPRGKARGNEYQPSNLKRKHKHGWVRRLSTPAGVQVLLRRMLKGRKSLSH